MRQNLEAIRRTIDLYDPDRQTVVVGTAALALQGIRVPGGVPDVDTLSPQHYVDEIRADVNDGRFGWSTGFDGYDSIADRISLKPMAFDVSSKGLLPYQSFCEVIDERYDMDFYLAYARSVMIDDVRVVPAHDILMWKATIGREKDLSKVQKILSRRSINSFLLPEVKEMISEKAAESRNLLEEAKAIEIGLNRFAPYDPTPLRSLNTASYGRTSSYGYPSRKQKAYASIPGVESWYN